MSNKVPWRSNRTFRIRGPVDEDGNTLTTGTCVGKVFEQRAENRLRADAAAIDVTISLRSEPRFDVGDTLRIARSDGTFLESTISSIDYAAKTVTLAAAVGVLAHEGAIVEKKIGADFACAVYNAAGAAVGTKDWGWRGSILPTQVGITIDRTYVVEMQLVSGAFTVTHREPYEFTDEA